MAGSLLRVLRPVTFLRLLLILLLCGGVGVRSVKAEMTEAQKKALFRKKHSSAGASSKGSKSGSGKSASSKSKGTSSSSSKKGSAKKRSSTSPSSSKRTGKGKNASHQATTTPTPAPLPSQTPPVTGSASTEASPGTLPLPHGATPSAPITIEKSGVEQDQGLEPTPTPAPAAEGFWSRIFGSHRSYTYLSSSTRSAIDRAPVRRGRWKYIVVHNSGTREGNARVFDVYHKRVRHMQNGLAYHFVIGDGHGSGNGQVEVGPRWTKQINGGHVASDYLNDIALGICLVGDFNRDTPTKAQIGALEELVAYLRERVGKSQGRRAIVHAHKEINPRPTDCPGDRFPYGWLHAKFGNAR